MSIEEEIDNINNNTGLVYTSSNVSQKRTHRSSRFRQRFYLGFEVHKRQIARWFVLTESDEAIEKGFDIIQKFNELVRMLRRKYGKFEYCCVRHRQGDKKRVNIHVVYFGEWIDQQVIEDWWLSNYASHRSRMGVVYKPKNQAWYLSKYLSSEDFERYYFSNEWVFKGWVGFSQWIKKEFRQYPTKEMLLKLANMSTIERSNSTWFGLYLEQRKKV